MCVIQFVFCMEEYVSKHAVDAERKYNHLCNYPFKPYHTPYESRNTCDLIILWMPYMYISSLEYIINPSSISFPILNGRFSTDSHPTKSLGSHYLWFKQQLLYLGGKYGNHEYSNYKKVIDTDFRQTHFLHVNMLTKETSRPKILL